MSLGSVTFSFPAYTENDEYSLLFVTRICYNQIRLDLSRPTQSA